LLNYYILYLNLHQNTFHVGKIYYLKENPSVQSFRLLNFRGELQINLHFKLYVGHEEEIQLQINGKNLMNQKLRFTN
jgi:hypothetical protein